ncbi:MAG: hypothetical protein QXE90_02085 [Candidatus Micrarchaeia archaeon]
MEWWTAANGNKSCRSRIADVLKSSKNSFISEEVRSIEWKNALRAWCGTRNESAVKDENDERRRYS